MPAAFSKKKNGAFLSFLKVGRNLDSEQKKKKKMNGHCRKFGISAKPSELKPGQRKKG